MKTKKTTTKRQKRRILTKRFFVFCRCAQHGREAVEKKFPDDVLRAMHAKNEKNKNYKTK